MRKICDLDIEKYQCVTPEIRTSEVIITEERIAHIQRRHPLDFERYAGYLKEWNRLVRNKKILYKHE